MKKILLFKNIVWIFILLNFQNSVSFGQTSSENYFSPDNRLKFGNILFSEKDYLRALNEFKEYLKTNENDTVRFKFAECFYKIGRLEEAAENFKGLFFGSSFQQEARLNFYKSIFYQNDFDRFRFNLTNENYFPVEYEKELIRLKYISMFMDNSVLPDTNIFYNAFSDSNKNDIRKFYLAKRFPKYKNPTTAAILSLIIPGAGKIYAGEIGDGITVFLATGLLTYLSATNFNHNHDFRGWLFAGLAAFTYAGNIYGSAASAHIYNAGVKFNFENELKIYFEKRNYFLPGN